MADLISWVLGADAIIAAATKQGEDDAPDTEVSPVSPARVSEPASVIAVVQATSEATYTRLRSGAWGLRVVGPAEPGQAVTVRTRTGAVKTERIGRVIWTGNGVSVCATAPREAGDAPAAPRQAAEGGYHDCARGCGRRCKAQYAVCFPCSGQRRRAPVRQADLAEHDDARYMGENY